MHQDVIPGAGALGGIYTSLEIAAADLVVTVACDLPFLDAGLLGRLVELAAGHDGALVRTVRGPEPLLACYQRAARQRIRDEIEAGRFKAADLGSVLNLAELDDTDVARFGPVDRLLANINTPDDYERLKA